MAHPCSLDKAAVEATNKPHKLEIDGILRGKINHFKLSHALFIPPSAASANVYLAAAAHLKAKKTTPEFKTSL